MPMRALVPGWVWPAVAVSLALALGVLAMALPWAVVAAVAIGFGTGVGAVALGLAWSDRSANRDRLEAAEDYAEKILDTLRESLVLLEPDMTVRGANRAFFSQFGGTLDESLGRRLADLSCCDWLTPEVEDRLRAAFAAGPFENFEVHHHAAAGPRSLVLNGRTFTRRLGEPRLYVLAAEDVTARRLAEESVLASEERFRVIVESARDYAIFSTDLAGTITTWNTGAEAVFGWPEAEILGQSFAIVFTSEDRDARIPERELATAANVGRAEDNRWHLRQDGSRFYASGVVTPVRNSQGVAVGFSKIARDMTAAKRAAEELQANRHFLQSSLDALTPHIAVLDEHGVILEVNGAWRKFGEENGLKGEEYAIGQNYLDACNTSASDCMEDARAVAFGICSVLDGAVPEFTLIYPCHSPSEERWYQLRVTRFLADGRPRGVVAHENVTERHLANELIRNRSEQLKRLATMAARVNVANDVRSVVTMVTEEARRLIGTHQAATVLTPTADPPGATAFSHSESLSQWADYRVTDSAGFFSTLEGLTLPVRLTTAALTAHPHFGAFQAESQAPPLRGLLVVPLLGRDGQPLGLIQLSDRVQGEFTEDDENLLVQLAQMAAVAVENARLYEQLLEADRQKNEFLAMLAHELRNPLAPIRNALEVMRQADPASDSMGRARRIVERQVTQMVRLVDDLLDVSRLSRGQITLRKQPTDLIEVGRTTAESSRAVVESAGHTLDVMLADGPVAVEADPTRISQVLANLLTNAAKYTRPGGHIALDVGVQSGQAVIRVRDTGVGLPPEMLTRVFDMFTQVDTSLERSQGGLGIGLTLVKRLVEMHGGTVVAESPGLNQGSCFTVNLPLAAPARSATPTEAELVLPEAALKILVADDNRDSAESLVLMLTLCGHEVRMAADGEEALELAEAFRPDVVLTDIGMPKLNGYDVARQLRQRPWATAVVVAALTGWGQDDDKERARTAGVNFHLIKPVDLAALNRVLSTVQKPVSLSS